jgi:hypothetical protein
MTRMTLTAILVFTLAFAGAAAATAEAPASAQGFVPALVTSLEGEGWSLQERTELALAAGQLDWNGTQEADAEAVALALTLQDRERLQLSTREKAQEALQLALMTAEMRAAGFSDHDTAVAALSAVRDMQGEIKAWMAGGRHGELGQIIREQVAAAVRQQVRLAADTQGAGKGPDDRQGQALGRGPAAMGPGSGPGGQGKGR